MGLDTDQRRAEPFGGGENSCVIIQPSANPANRNVTAVGRSYEGRIVFFVSMIAFTFWLNGQSKKPDTPLSGRTSRGQAEVKHHVKGSMPAM
jgi:hypothetical protein